MNPIAVAEVLRKLTQKTPHGSQSRVTAIIAQLKAEQEMAVQAVLYLYNHCAQAEQWREGVMLLAYALQHSVREDPRARDIVQHALSLLGKNGDANGERALQELATIEDISTDHIRVYGHMQPRARYWLRATRVSTARTALEYGTCFGYNVMHAAQVAPDIQWYGTDVSLQVVAACQQKADSLGVDAKFVSVDTLQKFDCIGVLDTLEHTLFPHTLLTAAEQLLEPGGIVVVTTPHQGWSHATENITGLGPGQHLAVEVLTTLVKLCGKRGRVLDAEVVAGPIAEELNSSACVTYQPHFKGPTEEPIC